MLLLRGVQGQRGDGQEDGERECIFKFFPLFGPCIYRLLARLDEPTGWT
jgi:hypothetical protein